MHWVYVLKSSKNQQLYIGTAEDVALRLRQHNAGKVQSTRPHRPYDLIYVERYESKTIALQRERQMKKSGLVRKALKDGVYRGPIV